MGIRKDSRVLEHSQEVNGRYLLYHNKIITAEGAYYRNMMTRATNENYKNKYPTYKGVSVSDNMSNFQFFVGWCKEQIGFGNVGWVLDKDLVLQGNTLYHEDSCVFVPPVINGFILNNKKTRRNIELPLGVTKTRYDKFMTCCAQLNGKNKTIGRYNDTTEAGLAYIKCKNNLAQDLANMWEGKVDDRVILFLRNYDVVEQTVKGVSTHPLYL